MLSQNRSEGSSTSRASPKLPCYGLVGRPSNSAMNNLPGTFSLRNHFSSFPLFRPRSRSQAPPEVRYFFRRNHFSSCRPAEPVRLEAARKSGSQGDRGHSFRGNHFSSFLPAEIGCPETPADRIAGNHCTVFGGTTFPPSFQPRLARRKRRHWTKRGPTQC